MKKIITELNKTYSINTIDDVLIFCEDHNLTIQQGTVEILKYAKKYASINEINEFLEWLQDVYQDNPNGMIHIGEHWTQSLVNEPKDYFSAFNQK